MRHAAGLWNCLLFLNFLSSSYLKDFRQKTVILHLCLNRFLFCIYMPYILIFYLYVISILWIYHHRHKMSNKKKGQGTLVIRYEKEWLRGWSNCTEKNPREMKPFNSRGNIQGNAEVVSASMGHFSPHNLCGYLPDSHLQVFAYFLFSWLRMFFLSFSPSNPQPSFKD